MCSVDTSVHTLMHIVVMTVRPTIWVKYFCLKLLACAIWRASFCSLHLWTNFCHFSFGDKSRFHWIGYDQEGICEKHLTHDGSKRMQVGNYCHLLLNVQSTYSSCKLCEFKVTDVRQQTTQWHSWLRHCYKPGGYGFYSRWCQWNFSLMQSFWLQCGPGVHSAFNSSEYQEYSLGEGG
jgi:hypothetical protein